MKRKSKKENSGSVSAANSVKVGGRASSCAVSGDGIQRCDEEQSKIGFFSFFTVAGFLDLGFEDVGFVPMMANEIDKNFSRAYLYSHEQMKRPLPRFGLQTGDVCAYLETDASRRELARLSTFDLGFKFFRRDNLQNAACCAGFMRLSPRKAV